MITSTSNPKIQYIRSLLGKKQFREENHAFVVEGVRLVEEVLRAKQKPKIIAYSPKLSSRGQKIVSTFLELKIECEEVAENVMTSLTDTETAQGILAVLPFPELPFPQKPDFLVIADEIRDPGNLGTILRSSLSAGVQGIILTPGTVDAFAPKVLRSGMGSQFFLPIVTMGWKEITSQIKKRIKPPLNFFYTISKKGEPYWKKDFTQPLALIIGGEAEGVSPEAVRVADDSVQIPMPGQTESLNAAVAAGIFIFEVVRQRSK
jgi:RNA methyltransferase, TrmH family